MQMKHKVTIANPHDLPPDPRFEPPMSIVWAITELNCPEARGKVCGQYTVVPPGTRLQRHYHKGCDAVICFVKGRFKLILGDEAEEIPVAVHTFAYIPRGEIHAYANMDSENEAEEIAYYIGVSNKDAAETVFIEDENFQAVPEALETWRRWRERPGTPLPF
jgi:quercetin dioxygenase-like cupin family protein